MLLVIMRLEYTLPSTRLGSRTWTRKASLGTFWAGTSSTAARLGAVLSRERCDTRSSVVAHTSLCAAGKAPAQLNAIVAPNMPQISARESNFYF